MYTLPMSRSFRLLVLSVTMLWALGPQIACFMPDRMTETEQECCKQMANDCSGSGMSHECCRTVVHSDVGTLAAANRGIGPESTVADITLAGAPAAALTVSGNVAGQTHAPPHDSATSSVVLRI